MIHKGFGYFHSSYGFSLIGHGDQNHQFGHTLCPHQQAVMSLSRAGQVDEIHSPLSGRLLRKDMGLNESSREAIGALGRLTSRTGRHILGDKATHIRPIEILGDRLEGTLHPRMASLIMKIATNVCPERAGGNHGANAALSFTDPQDSIVNHIEHSKFALSCTKGVQELLNNSRDFRVVFLRGHNCIIEQRMYFGVREDSILTGHKQGQDVLVLLQQQSQGHQIQAVFSAVC
jgi:hypothetical protein